MTCLKWTPDGTALAMTWSLGGFSLWSTFGSMIMCSLCWDYGIHVSDPVSQNPGRTDLNTISIFFQEQIFSLDRKGFDLRDFPSAYYPVHLVQFQKRAISQSNFPLKLNLIALILSSIPIHVFS